MTPGILALIALGVLVAGLIVVIVNFVKVMRGTVGDLNANRFIMHIVGTIACVAGMGGLIFSAAWFLVQQVGKGA